MAEPTDKKRLRAVLIDPDKQQITMIETEASRYDMYSLLSREGSPHVDDISSVRLTEQDTLWVDGEGFLKPDIPVFRMAGYPSPLAGRGLILGIDGRGQDCDVSSDALGFALQAVSWTDQVSTGKLTPGRQFGPGRFHIGDPITKTRGAS